MTLHDPRHAELAQKDQILEEMGAEAYGLSVAQIRQQQFKDSTAPLDVPIELPKSYWEMALDNIPADLRGRTT